MPEKSEERENRLYCLDYKLRWYIINFDEGGSAVHSYNIYNKLKLFTRENEMKLLTFAEDVAASGGYMMLLSGEKIYAEKSSLVGSVGVISMRTNIDKLLKKQKVKLHSYNEFNHLSKAMNPLEPKNAGTKKYLDDFLQSGRVKFIEMVQNEREGKWKLTQQEIDDRVYEADIFMGQEAYNIGLVDELGNHVEVLESLYPENKLVYVTPGNSYLQSLTGVSTQIERIEDKIQNLLINSKFE